MSFTDMLSEHAARSVVGGAVLGLLSGVVLMWSRGMSNATQIVLLGKDLKHREELREIERKAANDKIATMENTTNARLTALETSVSALQTHMMSAQTTIMAKLDQIEKDLHK